MSKYPGNILTDNAPVYNPASGGGTPGIWSLNDAAYAAQNQSWNMYDPYWKNTTLLLNGENAANAAQNNTFLDSSTNNFTITRNGNTTQGTFSPYGSLWSNYFDGSGDFLRLPSSTAWDFGTGDFTIEFWVYPIQSATSANETYYPFVGTDGSYTNGYTYNWVLLYVNQGGANKLAFNRKTTTSGGANNVSIQSNSFTLNYNTWIHIAAVRQSGTIYFYVNGIATGSGAYPDDISITQGLVINAMFGGASFQSVAWTPMGYTSNLRIVKGTAVYTANFTPPTAPLTAISGTSLLTCQSNRFVDNSSNNFAITVNGNTSVQRFSPFNPTAPYSASTIGGSGYFDGSGDYLTLASNAALQFGSSAFTIECWVYLPSYSSWNAIIQRSTTNNIEYYLGVTSDGTAYFGFTSNGTTENDITSNAYDVKIGQWNHIVVSKSGTSIYIGVNGKLTSGSAYSSIYSATQLTYVGSSTNNGYISDLRVLKGTALYSGSTYTIPTAPVTAITNTSLLCNFTNAGIPDAAMMNDLETVGNAQVSTSVKKYGTGSLAFDGSGDRLQAPVNPNYSFGTGNFTIEWWVYVNSWTATASTAVRIAGSSDWVCQYNGSGVLNFYNGATTVVTDTAAPSTSTWTHFAIVRNGTTVTLYRDGTSRATATHSSSVGATNVLLVGCGGDSNNNAYCLNGYIDDLRITKGIARYTANFTPPTSSLQNL